MAYSMTGVEDVTFTSSVSEQNNDDKGESEDAYEKENVQKSTQMSSYVSDAASESKVPTEETGKKKGKNNKQTSDPKFRCRFYEKNLPEYEEIVMVQVNSIAEMGAYVSLLEYDGIEGMILLSELSRRRIRSINKLIRVGKTECVSVLRVDRDKGYIDLSKRRVSADQLKATTKRYNKGKVVHAIMSTVAQKMQLSLIELNRMITWPLSRSKMFPHPRDAFVMAIQDPDTIFEELKRVSIEYLAQLEVRLKNLNDKKLAGRTEALDAGHHRGGKDEEEEEEEEMAAIDMEASIEVLKKSIGGLPEDIKAMLLANIKRRLTPQPIKIRADVDVSCYSYQGIDAVKNALREAKKFGSEEFPMTISLIAPPQYTIQTTSLEKKEGIARCNQAVEAVKKSILAAGGRLAVKMEAKATTVEEREGETKTSKQSGGTGTSANDETLPTTTSTTVYALTVEEREGETKTSKQSGGTGTPANDETLQRQLDQIALDGNGGVGDSFAANKMAEAIQQEEDMNSARKLAGIYQQRTSSVDEMPIGQQLATIAPTSKGETKSQVSREQIDDLKDVQEDDIEAMFATMKKKKSKKKSKKKKKKKSKDNDEDAGSDADSDKDGENEESETATELYTYNEMLDRVFERLQSNNPELMHKKRKKCKIPQIMRIGTRKCMWHNYPDICETLKRKPDHIMQFYLTELGTTGNLDGNGRLVLKGTFGPKKIESLLRKYITEYVTCHLCKSPDTDLIKDPASRLFFVQCHACGARRSVSTIKTGYLATQRGERRAARNK